MGLLRDVRQVIADCSDLTPLLVLAVISVVLLAIYSFA